MSHDKTYKKLINSTTWLKLRNGYITAHPLCEDCLAEGKVREAQEVHHVVPIESVQDEWSMRRLAYDPNNLRALCRDCHHAAHGRFTPRERIKKRNEDKINAFARMFLDDK